MASAAAQAATASSSGEEAAARQAHVSSLLQRLLSRSAIYAFALSELELESARAEAGGAGRVRARLRLTERHVNSRGALHGAVSAALVDLTTGLAIAAADGREATGASVDMHLSYLSAAARAGDVVRVQADADRVGGSLAFVSVRIARVDEASGLETVVALGRHTKYVKGTAPAERG